MAFLFSSQGGQWPGMGSRLLTAEPSFRDAIVRCGAEIERILGWSLVGELTRTGDAYRLHCDNAMIQPALTSVQIALAEMLRSHGVKPSALAGLSMGEVAAAHIGGFLSIQDAFEIVCCQARLTARPLSRRGRMAFIGADSERARALLEGCIDRVSIAVELSPEMTIVSGEERTVERIAEDARARGWRAGMVPIGFAFHSPEVRSLKEEFYASLGELRPSAGNGLPIYSSVLDPSHQFGVSHWWKIMSQPASLVAVTTQLLAEGYETIVEIGPHPVLIDPVRQTARSLGLEVDVLPIMRRDIDEQTVAKEALRALAAC